MTNLSIKDDSQSGHHVSYTVRLDGNTRAKCSCGGEWVHYTGDTDDYRKRIFESHKKYFDRPAMPVL